MKKKSNNSNIYLPNMKGAILENIHTNQLANHHSKDEENNEGSELLDPENPRMSHSCTSLGHEVQSPRVSWLFVEHTSM